MSHLLRTLRPFLRSLRTLLSTGGGVQAGFRHRAMALLMVLIALVIISALALAFFSRVNSEVGSATAFAAGTEARTLSDAAVNLVIAQIRDATASTNSGGNAQTWASQPGLIRIYDTTSTNDVATYKLYSATSLRTNGAYNPVTSQSTEIPSNWATRTGEFVDLNTPIVRVMGTATNYDYPILDPMDLTNTTPSTKIEGYAITNAAFITNRPVASGGIGKTHTEIPMPVRWLYTLRDGTMGTYTGTTFTATIGAGTPSTANPIVGRIAFWTDDETCKLNVNTASHGVFHGKPYGDSGDKTPANMSPAFTERRFGWSLPVANEFQRIPGHPATTSLSPVFKSIWDADSFITGNLNSTTFTNNILPYYKFSPKISTNAGSAGMTVMTSSNYPGATFNPPKMTPQTNRLYATPDEIAFAPDRSLNVGGALTNLLTNNINFFLTTSSSAPEVTQFGTPRITLWPLQNTNDANFPGMTRNTKDRAIAFVSTINNTPYFFQRNGVTKAMANGGAMISLNYSVGTTLPDCLDPDQDLTPTSTVGRRNCQLYTYVQSMTGQGIPGYGSGSFSGKYGVANRNQLITQMVDFVRSNINIQATSTNSDFLYRFVAVPNETASQSDAAGPLRNVVVPLMPTVGPAAGTKGLGNFGSVTGMVMDFLIDNYNYTITTNVIAPTPPATASTTNYTTNVTTNDMKMFLTFEFNNPCASSPGVNFPAKIVVSGLNSLTVDVPSSGVSSTPLFASASAANWIFNASNSSTTAIQAINANGPVYSGLQFRPITPSSTRKDTTASGATTSYNFISTTIPTVPVTGINLTNVTGRSLPFTLNGGNLTVQLYSILKPGDATTERLVQTLTIPVQRVTCPVPVPVTPNNAFTNAVSGEFKNRFTNPSRFDLNNPPFNNDTADSGNTNGLGCDKFDTIRMVTLDPSQPTVDYRVITSLSSVTSGFSPLTNANYASYTDSLSTYNYAIWESNPDNGRDRYVGRDKGASRSIPPSAYCYPSCGNYALFGGGSAQPYAGVFPVQLSNGPTTGVRMVNGELGDFDSGIGNFAHNALSGRLERGSLAANFGGYYGDSPNAANLPYTMGFNPSMEITSAVFFGGLLTQSASSPKQWESLLFCANPAATMANHPGSLTPPDHLWLDLFTMPIVEPLPTTLPFTSSGKVNLNYQIAPFTYIQRSTALRGVLKFPWLFVDNTLDSLPSPWAKQNQVGGAVGLNPTGKYRYTIHPDKTLEAVDALWFSQGKIFKSASQVCEIPLVPAGLLPSTNPVVTSYTGLDTWWYSNGRSTGDNAREEPYGQIYPRVTTKSNTYTVHVRAQALRVPANENYSSLDPSRLAVVGEYRGSSTIERYVDPTDPRLVANNYDPAGNGNLQPLDPYYRFRTLLTRDFQP